MQGNLNMQEMRNYTSLLTYCKRCGSHCCLNHSPILDLNERALIVNSTSNDFFIEVSIKLSKPDGVYYVIGKNPDRSERNIFTEQCPFLQQDGKCSIHPIKPLDCAVYPLRAIPKLNGGISWSVHRICPAVGFLTTTFIQTAKQIGEMSARRFSPQTYVDWLNRFADWSLHPESELTNDFNTWESELRYLL